MTYDRLVRWWNDLWLILMTYDRLVRWYKQIPMIFKTLIYILNN